MRVLYLFSVAGAIKVAQHQQPQGPANNGVSMNIPMPIPTSGVLSQVNLAQTMRTNSNTGQGQPQVQMPSAQGMSGSPSSICDPNLQQPVCSKADNWGRGVFITHKNACFASQLGFGAVEHVGQANPHYTEGPCTEDQNSPSNQDDPVCVHDMFVGTDPLHPMSVTFPNNAWVSTYFGIAMMRQLEEKGGPGWKTAGPCSLNCKNMCEVFQPVCGESPSGATTFPNLCAAQVMSLPGKQTSAGICADVTNPNVVFPHFWNTEGWLKAHSAPSGYKWETRPFLVPENKVIVPAAPKADGVSRKIQFRVQECIEIKLVCIRTRDLDFRTYMNRCLAQEDGYNVGTDDPSSNFINDIAHLKSSNTEEIGECRENAHQRYIGKSEHGSPEAGCEKLAPVCSADGLITFLNACQAHKMGYTDVSKLLQGACFNNDQVVPEDHFFEPICDETRQATFINKAQLDRFRGMRAGNGVNQRYHMGACSRWTQAFRSQLAPNLKHLCKFELYVDPQCVTYGSNGDQVTFLNRCIALLYGHHSTITAGACESQNSAYSLLQLKHKTTPRKNPIEQGIWSYPYHMKLTDFYNPEATGKHHITARQVNVLFSEANKAAKSSGKSFFEVAQTLNANKQRLGNFLGTSFLQDNPSNAADTTTTTGVTTTADSGTTTSGALSSTGSSMQSLNMAESALWALKNCTTLEPICDVQEMLATHLNWCMAQRAGVQSPVGTVYKACPAGGMTMYDTECGLREADVCVAGAKFSSRCAAWEAGETNMKAARQNLQQCEGNFLEQQNGGCPTPSGNDDVCSLANGFTHYQSMCKLQEDGAFWLPFILEGKCSDLARFEIDVRGIWPRCATVQEAFDRYNQTFEAAITDALLLTREQNENWKNLNSFGWAFGATCHSCSGAAAGCMMQKIEQLGLLGEDDMAPMNDDDNDLNNQLRSADFYNGGSNSNPTTTAASTTTTAAETTTTAATTTTSAASNAQQGGGGSFVQTGMEAMATEGRYHRAKAALVAQRKANAESPANGGGFIGTGGEGNWRRSNAYRTMKVRVGIRCHASEESGNACEEFTRVIFGDDEKMKTLSLHIRHNLESVLQTNHGAFVDSMSAYAKGGAGTLTWAVDANSTVMNLYAAVEEDNNRVRIVNADGKVEALVAFHKNLVIS